MEQAVHTVCHHCTKVCRLSLEEYLRNWSLAIASEEENLLAKGRMNGTFFFFINLDTLKSFFKQV